MGHSSHSDDLEEFRSYSPGKLRRAVMTICRILPQSQGKHSQGVKNETRRRVLHDLYKAKLVPSDFSRFLEDPPNPLLTFFMVIALKVDRESRKVVLKSLDLYARGVFDLEETQLWLQMVHERVYQSFCLEAERKHRSLFSDKTFKTLLATTFKKEELEFLGLKSPADPRPRVSFVFSTNDAYVLNLQSLSFYRYHNRLLLSLASGIEPEMSMYEQCCIPLYGDFANVPQVLRGLRKVGCSVHRQLSRLMRQNMDSLSFNSVEYRMLLNRSLDMSYLRRSVFYGTLKVPCDSMSSMEWIAQLFMELSFLESFKGQIRQIHSVTSESLLYTTMEGAVAICLFYEIAKIIEPLGEIEPGSIEAIFQNEKPPYSAYAESPMANIDVYFQRFVWALRSIQEKPNWISSRFDKLFNYHPGEILVQVTVANNRIKFTAIANTQLLRKRITLPPPKSEE